MSWFTWLQVPQLTQLHHDVLSNWMTHPFYYSSSTPKTLWVLNLLTSSAEFCTEPYIFCHSAQSYTFLWALWLSMAGCTALWSVVLLWFNLTKLKSVNSDQRSSQVDCDWGWRNINNQTYDQGSKTRAVTLTIYGIMTKDEKALQ